MMADDYFQTNNDVTRLFDNIQSSVPGVTTDMVSLAAWNTIEDFYVKSTYRREHVYWRLDPGEINLDFDPYDCDWRVCRFMGFTGLAKPKFVPPGRVIDVSPVVPDSVRNGEALLALRPKDINVELPADIWTTYWEALYNGTLHRLYLQPGKPYSDLNAGTVYGRLYRSGIASARADAQAWHLRDAQAWSYPYYASGGHSGAR
jgi:hypothetical protein